MFKPLILTTAIIAGMSLGATSVSAAPLTLQADSALSSPILIKDGKRAHGKKYYKQFHEHGHHRARHRLGPRQIKKILRHRGYRNVRIVDIGPRRAVVRARGYRGPVQLLVNRRTGDVVARQVLRRHHYGHRGFRGHKNGYSFSFGFNL